MDDLLQTCVNLPVLDWQTELDELPILAGEAMGWHALDDGAYVHPGGSLDLVDGLIEVVGQPDPALVGSNVLLLI